VELSAIVASGKSPAAVEAELHARVGKLARTGRDAAEIDSAKRRLFLGIHSDIELVDRARGESGCAGLRHRLDHHLVDPSPLDALLQRSGATSAADIRRVVAQELRPDARVTVVTVPRQATE